MTAIDNLDLTSSDSVIDTLVQELMQTETLSLSDRINGNTIELNNYLKHDGGNGRKTGTALLLNKVKNLCVIDVDINKTYNDELKEKVRNMLLNKLSNTDVIVKTASGGLHIYCNTDFFTVSSNRMIKCYSCSDFDIDLMTSVEPNKRSLIVLPNSRVRQNATTPIKRYDFVRGSYETCITRSVNDVLRDLDITIKVKQTPEIDEIIKDTAGVMISDELSQAIVDGLCDFEVHNDGGNMTLDKEVTLFTLFQAVNSLPKQYIQEAYENIFQFCKLTDNARINFENARNRYACLATSPFVLVKILKLYQQEYYTEYVKPLINNEAKQFDINLSDSFCLTNIREKAEKKMYKNNSEVIEDLSRVIRFVDSGNKMFIQKEYNIHSKTWSVTFVSDKAMKDSLKMIHLWKEERKLITAYDVLLTQLTSLTVKGVAFNSDDDNVFSTFQGYKYKVLDKINYSVIETFINFIHEVICNNNDEAFTYVIGWIANMIQNPGKKNETALVLKGLQGIGKNRFTDIISELTAGYSCKNVTEINELTGTFNSVVENKMFIVLNEMKNNGDDRLANFNTLKSIITDDVIRINEKNQPRRTAENVANFVFVTNNSFPVKIESGDRRYIVLHCNGKYKGQFEFFKNLMGKCTPEFYDNLLTYFIKYDLSAFNVRCIPMTEAKQDLIEASRTPVDQWICDHYTSLLEGMECSTALSCKPKDMKDKTFQLQIKDKCERKQLRRNGMKKWYYILKEEYRSIYKQNTLEEDEYIIYEDDIPTKQTVEKW